jgi:glycosyltransferase involved in cell wall biosynthesis
LLPTAFSSTRGAAGGGRDFLAQVHGYFSHVGGTPAPQVNLASGAPVVVLTHALPAGGAERQWCYLAHSLKKLGFAVTFVVTEELGRQNSHYLPLLRDAGIEVVEIAAQSPAEVVDRLPKGPRAGALLGAQGNPFHVDIHLLCALLRKLNPQVVIAQLDSTNILAAIAAHLADVPRVVLSFRNYNPSNFSYLDNDWFRPCYQAACLSGRTVLVGNSTDANRDYAQWIGIPEARVHWVPNAIDEKDFAAAAPPALAGLRAELGLGDASQMLLGVFRLSEEKQPDVFLEVVARLVVQLPGLKVYVAGEGRLHQTLEQRIEQLRIGHAVTLLGRRNDVPDLMRIADVMLLTSSHEGMPNAVMEAQLLGLPVVATRTGGTPDCVVHEHTGLLAEVGDVEALYRSTLRLLRDPGLAKAMGDAGSVRMRQYFSKQAMALRYVELLGGQVSVAPRAVLEAAT